MNYSIKVRNSFNLLSQPIINKFQSQIKNWKKAINMIAKWEEKWMDNTSGRNTDNKQYVQFYVWPNEYKGKQESTIFA